MNVHYVMFLCNGVLHFQLNLGISPKCEQFYRQQGYDFKLSNGRIVLVRRTPRSARHRRQEQVGHLDNWATNELLPAGLTPKPACFHPTAQQHPSGPGPRAADHSPSEDGGPADHLDRTRTGQGAGRGGAQIHRGQPPLIHGLPAGHPL